MRTVWNVKISALVLVYLAIITTSILGQGSPEARKLKNPVAITPASIEAGRKAYGKFCAFCHGADAKGEGPMAPKDSHPPNLTNGTWKHGSSDGEIFTVISDGVGGKSVMKSFKSKLTPEEIWDVVIYLRSLAKH